MKRRPAVSFAVLLLAGCARPRGELLVPPQPAIVWPPPPDLPRIQYIGEIKGSDDLKPGKTSAQVLGEIFRGPSAPERLVTPHAVAVHPDGGRVAVADTNAACIHVFDLQRREYSRRETCGPSGPRFESPVGVAWVEEALWVADSRLQAVAVLEPGSERLIGQEVLKRPAGLAYCATHQRCYITDSEAHAVVAFARDGRVALKFGSHGTSPGQFNFPSQIACGPDGSIVVADSMNFRVQRFGSDGTPLGTFGRKGDAAGDLALPKGVAVAADGSIWVVDTQFENVQGFNEAGELLMAFGREGQGSGEFWLPAGLCIDAQRRMWVADSYNRRVQVFQLLP